MAKRLIVINACTACKRRKVKCVGNPCAFCLKKNYICEFKQQSKRGPKTLQLPSSDIDSEFRLDLNHIQEVMGQECQKNSFIDFYFQYIGKAIPFEYKQYLISSNNDNERKSQFHIITASIMKLYGNEDAASQYITKARRASDLFECDTIESSITLIMMALYMGNDIKSHNLILMALNILKLPNIANSSLVSYLRGACQALSVLYDPSLSQQSKSTYVLGLFAHDVANNNNKDLMAVCVMRAKHTMCTLMQYDDANVSSFLQSITLPFQNEYTRSRVLDELQKILEMLGRIQFESDKMQMKLANAIILHYQFIVEWRCGYKIEAFKAAIKVIEFCKSNLQPLAIRFSNMVSLLSIPYFFREYGALELENECLSYLQNVYSSTKKTEQLNLTWAEMSGNLGTYKIAQLETELLGDLGPDLGVNLFLDPIQ